MKFICSRFSWNDDPHLQFFLNIIWLVSSPPQAIHHYPTRWIWDILFWKSMDLYGNVVWYDKATIHQTYFCPKGTITSWSVGLQSTSPTWSRSGESCLHYKHYVHCTMYIYLIPPSYKMHILWKIFLWIFLQIFLSCTLHNHLVAPSYPIFLVVICTIYAVLTRKIPEAFNESKFIGFSM